jgi:serine/threonine protein kinase
MSDANLAERIAEIVENALERDPRIWPGFLDETCGGDTELRAEVESLLQFNEQARDFIEVQALHENAGAFTTDGGELKTGATLGTYTIRSLIGEGGMGDVYLADDTSLNRQVAIKLVKRGLATANIVGHFRDEERILAGLTHPHIARLYGGGVTSEGAPYFVMEYVEGERLDDYCNAKQLTLRERLELFRKVCSAVSYAHQHLVVHRDLKPANIRVTPEGEPKLLDFGIAKLLDPQSTSAADQTITLKGVMTPDYASPEQIRAEPMTTASDVYSLGVVLYELLTGQKPYRIATGSEKEIALAITEQVIEPPSAVAARVKERAASPLPNARALRGDLDNIILMATRKEATRRYASVGQFSEDIRRHLEGLPVIARKDTVRYRTAKFIKRHRVGVAAAALLVLTLSGGIVATAWQARRAERRFNDVRRLANSLMFEIHDSVAQLQGATPTRRLIVSRALEYLDSLGQEANDPSLQRELATAYEKIGDIQGNPYSENIGDTDGALASYRKAIAIREQLNQRHHSIEGDMDMGRSYRALGDIFE